MSNKWDEIAAQADRATNEHFMSQISSLTRLNDVEIENLITETGISKKDLTSVLKIVDEASKSNDAKADAIKNISKGINVLVGLAAKFI
jgi:hypothetical protein